MREHAAANESLKLALHEQGRAALFVALVELPKEALQVLAYHAVQHSVLWGAANIESRDLGAPSGSVNPHEYGTPSRLVPSAAVLFSRLRGDSWWS
jgi:hypothetical protein